MLIEGKRERLARTIVSACQWLSRRSVKFRLLFEDVGLGLVLNGKRHLPAAKPVYHDGSADNAPRKVRQMGWPLRRPSRHERLSGGRSGPIRLGRIRG